MWVTTSPLLSEAQSASVHHMHQVSIAIFSELVVVDACVGIGEERQRGKTGRS